MSKVDVTVWDEPRIANGARADARRDLSRVVSTAVVIGIHVLAFAVLSSLSLRADRGMAKMSTPMEAALVETLARNEDSWLPAPPPEIAPGVIELPEPTLGDISEDANEGTAPTLSGMFIPPRPDSTTPSGLSQFARQASLPAGKMVRVILRVEVLPDGSTGTVAIDTASGFPSADSAAVEYARTLRWVPASYGGEPTAMKVRLPVVFTGTG